MRDKRKNNFKKIIKNVDKAVLILEKKIQTQENISVRKSLTGMLIDILLKKTIAQYSIGENKEVITSSLLDCITAFEEGFKWEGFENGYGDMDIVIWLVSLSILCDIELDNFKQITSIIERDNINDNLLDVLILSKQEDWVPNGTDYIQKHPYANTENFSTIDDVKIYLKKKWYQGHSDSYWYNSHKTNIKHLYFGYWAWEAAALVKIYGLDDTELKDTEYYPYDAVHWNDGLFA